MDYILKAEERTVVGKQKSKKLRKEGKIPAVIYGHGETAVNLVVNEKDFLKLCEEIKGRSPIVNLSIGDKPIVKAVIKKMQRAAVTKKLLAIDFQLVHAQEKITMNVPIILKGTAIGVKEGGILDQPLRSIPIRCEIDKVPDHIEIDISGLKMGHSIHISDIKIEGVEHILSIDSPVVSVLVPRKVVEVTPPVAEEIKEPEVITEKKKEEVAEEEAETSTKKKQSVETETKKDTKK